MNIHKVGTCICSHFFLDSYFLKRISRVDTEIQGEKMISIGIDIGTTTISMITMNAESGKIVGSRTIPHKTFLQGHIPESKIQDAEKIVGIVKETLRDLVLEYGIPSCIGLTGQMHGMLYVDENGNSVSPLYIWQDGCGNELMEDGRSYAEVLKQTGGAASTGFGITTHFYLQKNQRIPKTAVKMVTISDYVGMQLCGRKEPVIARDMAASWGCFDLEKGEFFSDKLKELGVDISYFPEVQKEHEVMGYVETENFRIPIIVSLGDNQASVLGSVQNLKETVLLNVGTGSQISVVTTEYYDCDGSIEFRPCMKENSLIVGSGLCGGRAYAMLEEFYREITGSEEALYGVMEKQAREFKETFGVQNAWRIKTTFSGTRSNPMEKGSIQNIGVENFHPGAMTVGMIQGMLEELYEMYSAMCEKTGKKATHLVGSGNGIRKNPLMREMAEDMFGLKMEIPVCREEAAYGCALYALFAAGIVSSLEEMQNKIAYLN